jgi:hypothetical protein
LAIYITVLLIVTVAVAQVLYWKLVIARENVASDETADFTELVWLRQPIDAWAGLETDEAQPALVDEPVPVDEPALVGAG